MVVPAKIGPAVASLLILILDTCRLAVLSAVKPAAFGRAWFSPRGAL